MMFVVRDTLLSVNSWDWWRIVALVAADVNVAGGDGYVKKKKSQQDEHFGDGPAVAAVVVGGGAPVQWPTSRPVTPQ